MRNAREENGQRTTETQHTNERVNGRGDNLEKTQKRSNAKCTRWKRNTTELTQKINAKRTRGKRHAATRNAREETRQQKRNAR